MSATTESAGSTERPHPERPWRDRQRLRALYVEQGLSIREIAEELGCAYGTVHNWLKEHDIPRRDPADVDCRVERATFTMDEGRPKAVVRDGSKVVSVYISQLTEIAHGADPHTVFDSGTLVHHRNGIPFDNRPANLRTVSPSDHQTIHASDTWMFDPVLGCAALV